MKRHILVTSLLFILFICTGLSACEGELQLTELVGKVKDVQPYSRNLYSVTMQEKGNSYDSIYHISYKVAVYLYEGQNYRLYLYFNKPDQYYADYTISSGTYVQLLSNNLTLYPLSFNATMKKVHFLNGITFITLSNNVTYYIQPNVVPIPPNKDNEYEWITTPEGQIEGYK